jgi:capsular polysaccharide biosynthesis protein
VLRSWSNRSHPVSAHAPSAGRAVVLTRRGSASPIAEALRSDRPGLEVVEVPAAQALGAIAGLGPVALIVDDAGDGPGVVRRFQRYFLLLADHGRYVAPRELEADLVALHPGDEDGAAAGPLAAAVAAVDVEGDVVVTRAGRGVVKLREEETTTALAADPGRGRVVSGIEAASFDSRCEFREMLPLSARVKRRYDAPPAVLREYVGAAAAPHSLVVQRGVVLADSFRHHPQKWLHNEKLVDVDRRYAEEPSWLDEDLPVLDGSWYHLDNEHRGHFGHALTEQVARMWAWDEAVRVDPDVRVLVAVNRDRTTLGRWELQLLEAAGIPRDRVTVIDRPVRVERLLGATPLFSMPFYVHPHITSTWDRMGAALRAQAPDRDHPRRIFCSRKIDKRSCHNARDVDAFFARRGFEVVFPEEFPLPEQAEMFHQAEVVAGFAGSALFNVMFTDRPKHVIAVASETYTPRNEYMIGALRGHRLDMSHSRPDESDPKFYTKRFMASFTFDFAREGQWLEDEVFPSLGD